MTEGSVFEYSQEQRLRQKVNLKFVCFAPVVKYCLSVLFVHTCNVEIFQESCTNILVYIM